MEEQVIPKPLALPTKFTGTELFTNRLVIKYPISVYTSVIDESTIKPAQNTVIQ